MTITLRKPMSVDEFLAWERAQELRYEFDGERAVAMTGGTVAHTQIATGLVIALGRRLGNGLCVAIRGDVKILVAGRVRYPDALVTCSPVANDSDIIPGPVAVFEVVSSSTEAIDRGAKAEEYQRTPSILHYGILEQTRIAATLFFRAGGQWLRRDLAGDEPMTFPSLGVTMPLSEAYALIRFPGAKG